MKFCSQCGKPLTDDMNFCSGCGHKVEKETKNEINEEVTVEKERKKTVIESENQSTEEIAKEEKEPSEALPKSFEEANTEDKEAKESVFESVTNSKEEKKKDVKEPPKELPMHGEEMEVESNKKALKVKGIDVKKMINWMKNHKKASIAIVVVVIWTFLMIPRAKIVGKDMTVNIGDAVYLTKSNLIDMSKTKIDPDNIKIEGELTSNEYNYDSDTGLVKTYGLTYLDAGTYEVNLVNTEDSSDYATVKINVVDEEAPKFVDFQKEIELDKGDSVNNLNTLFKADDKSKVTISVDKGKLNTSKVGKYKIKVTAKDTVGNKTTKNCTVNVVDKKLTGIEASYSGLTTAGTTISSTSNIKVVATYEDGSSKEVKGWTVENPTTLVADQASTIKIIYKDQTYDLSVQCSTLGEQGFKNACGDLAYEELARNADGHKGEKVKYSGRIVQVTNGSSGSVTLRVATSGNYDDIILVEYTYKSGQSKLLEDDTVTVYGTIYGDYTYESVMGAHITVPLVLASYIDR